MTARIGMSPNGYNPFAGMIDDVSVWNVTLDPASVMDYFLNGIPENPHPDGLVAYYRFNEGK